MVDDSGTTVTKEVAAFKSLATLYGFKPEDLGRTFTVRGKSYILTGIDRKSYKFPILVSCNGKMFKFPLDTVQLALGIPRTGARWQD